MKNLKNYSTKNNGILPIEVCAKITTCLIFAVVISGCGANMPIQKTGIDKEYVINRDDKSPFGNLPSVKRSAEIEASNYCESMGKKYNKRYSIDKERAVMVWPETTLYFECI